MIEYIKGELTELTPTFAIIETVGVGYFLNISLTTYTAIQGQKQTKLYVHEVLVTGGRDDAYTFYGFATKGERELYRLLISVSGIGANSARMILSSMQPTELCTVIANGDDKMLKTVKGIGAKTAQRVIVDLKDKIATSGLVANIPTDTISSTTINNEVREEAVSALTMLGFSPAPTHKIVTEILKEDTNLKVEEVIKLALKRIKN